MIRVIATTDRVGLSEDDDLPYEFGRAPSTVNFDHGRQGGGRGVRGRRG